MATAGEAELSDLVFVELGSKRYAVPTQAVVEVLQLLEPTPMPTWPANVLGVINVRGDLLPLVDCAPLLGRPPLTVRLSAMIVVVLAFGRSWGLAVDAVKGVGAGRIRRTEAGEAEAEARSTMLGVTVEETGMVIVVLSPEGLLYPLRTIGLELGNPAASTAS